jgi:hypothetical protein
MRDGASGPPRSAAGVHLDLERGLELELELVLLLTSTMGAVLARASDGWPDGEQPRDLADPRP